MPLKARDRLDSHGVGCLLNGNGLTRQHGFLDPQPAHLEKPEVGRHAVTGFQNDQVARHDLVAGNRPAPSGTQHRRLRSQHVADGLERLFRLAFLDEADDRVHDHHGQDHHGVHQMAQQRRDPRGSKKHRDQQIVELTQKAEQRALAFRFRQAVRPIELAPPVGLRVVQAVGRHFEGLQGLFCRAVMPG